MQRRGTVRMAFEMRRLAIPEVGLLQVVAHHDERGYLAESYHRERFAAAGIDIDFVQENHSRSIRRGVVRGLHFQRPPQSQAKLVRCVRGAILDVAVDIRRSSPSFGRHVAAVLSAENMQQLWIPAGFAHGFCALETPTEVVYRMSSYYAPTLEGGIAFDDPALSIAWPVPVQEMLVSEKDKLLPRLSEILPCDLL